MATMEAILKIYYEMDNMEAILKIYFELLLQNWKAKWLETL